MTACRCSAAYGARDSALPEAIHRAAVYYAPEAEDPLWAAGCAWLGRNPETGEALPLPQWREKWVAEPRRYGFHATLKAPMRLQNGFEPFLAAVTALAAKQAPFALPPLAVTRLEHFLALGLSAPSVEMQALAEACVTALDAHRLPEDAAAQARRAAGRPAVQRGHIARWGYPLVLDQFKFHMTLTNGIPETPLADEAAAFFAGALRVPREVKSFAVFVEPAPGAAFRLLGRLPFSSAQSVQALTVS